MRSKKAISLILCTLLLGSSLAACSSSKPAGEQVVTVAVTDKNGEVVTDKNGEVVTEVVSSTTSTTTSTTKKGNQTTSTTKATTTTTTKPAQTTKQPLREPPKADTENKYVYYDDSLSDDLIVLMPDAKGKTGSKNVTFEINNNQGICYINAEGDYRITAGTSLWHGQIIIQVPNTDEVSVRFENVNISSTTANVIRILDTSISNDRTFFEEEATADTSADNVLSETMKLLSKQQSAPNVSLAFPTGTSSSFTTSANSYSGVIYNESKLTIKGNGSVSITAAKNKNNAICSTKSVTFKNVTANLETAASSSTSSLSSARGIFSYSKVTVESGSLKIRSNGDCIRCDDLYIEGGTVDIASGACDGVDADDAIVITGGDVKSIALQKSSFKVRRINNQKDWNEDNNSVNKENCVTKSSHVFKIAGGTVWGEGKSATKTCGVSALHNENLRSSQVSILCRSAKSESSEEARKYIQFNISGEGVNVSTNNKCAKFLYSSPSLSKNTTYTISSPQGVKEKQTNPDKYFGNYIGIKIVSA